MKKVYSTIMMLAMMVAALSFTACGGDDDDEIEGEASIVGVWKCVSADYGEWEAYLKDNTRVGDLIYFNSDHTYRAVGNNNDSGTWSLNGNTLKIDSYDSYSIPMTYTVSQLTSNSLTITFSEDYITVKISYKREQ